MPTNPPAAGGATDIECTSCGWNLPGQRHVGHGTPARPAGADYIDAAMPRISRHIDETGHPVRVTITTRHADGRVERTSQLVSPHTGSAHPLDAA